MLVSCSTAVVAWAGLLKQLLAAIADYDEKIDALARQHPDYALMKSLPGAGPALAPRLIAALGSRRDRYQTAYEIQCYSGIAPVVASSGKQRWLHWRWSCPKFLRQTFHEWALHSVAYSQWAREYYEEQRAKGKRRNTAIRSLAFKWIRILFRRIKPLTKRPPINRRLLAAEPNHPRRSLLCNFSGKLLLALAKSLLPALDRTSQMSILRSGASRVDYINFVVQCFCSERR